MNISYDIVQISKRFGGWPYAMISKAVTHVREKVGAEEVLPMVAWHYDCDAAELTRTTRGRGGKNVGRWMAMVLCQDYSGMKLLELATLFGVSNDSTISVTVG